MKNNYEQATVRFIIFKDGDSWCGVVFEFNIVQQGDDPLILKDSLERAAIEYFQVAREKHLAVDVLNQETDTEYEDRWQKAQSKKFISDLYSSGVLHPALVAR